MARKKKIFPIFVITLVIGIGLVGFSFVGSDLQLDLSLLSILEEECPSGFFLFEGGCIEDVAVGIDPLEDICPFPQVAEIRPDGFVVCVGECPVGTIDEFASPAITLQILRDCTTNPELCEPQMTGQCTPIICPSNFELVGSECVVLDCPVGQFPSDNVCVVDDVFQEEQPSACIEIFDPVCGVNGQTFSNSCFADASGFEILHMGECVTTDPIVLDCPEGTEQQEDVCVQVLEAPIFPPMLEIETEGVGSLIFLIIGIIIIIISIAGIIVRRRR